MIEKKSLNKPLIICILLNFFWMLIILLSFEVIFDNTDDHLMSILLAGGKGEATSDIIFINVILSKIIYFLCTIFPIVNWLTIIEEGILFISFISISYVFYKMTERYSIALMIPIILSGYCYTTLTFSAVAMIGGGASCILLLYSLREEKKNIICAVLGVFLLMISIWLREMAVLGTVPFLGATVIEYWRKTRDKRCLLGKIIVLGIIIFLIMTISKVFHSNYYESREWYAFYNETNKARASVIDYRLRDYGEISEELQEIGISENDYKLIQARIFDDYKFFDNQALEEIAQIAGTQTDFLDKGKELLTNYLEIIERPFLKILFWFSICSLIFLHKRKSYIFKVLYIWLVIHLYAIYLYCYVGRFPSYVQDGIYFVAIILMLYNFISEFTQYNIINRRWISTRKRVVWGIIVLGVFFNANAVCISFRTEEYRYKNPSAQIFVEKMNQREDSFFFMDFLDECARIYARSVSPFEKIDRGFYSNLERLSSWDKALPVTNSQFEKHNIQSPLQDLLKANVFLISNLKGHVELILQYYKEHMDRDIECVTVEEYPELGINIYKFQEVVEK